MLSEILKIKPQLDRSDLNRMVSTLNTRFMDISKRFGQGLVNSTKRFGSGMKNALMGGGIIGALGALADRFLNPLKETTETLKRTLAEGDDLATFASQFETSAGKLFKLQTLAGSSGLDPESLRMMLTKFQVALAEQRVAEKDFTKPENERKGILSEFTGFTDTADAFFAFIQSLQAAPKDVQVLAQSQVFGEKMIGRQAEFLQTDFGKRLRAIGFEDGDTEKYTQSIEKIAQVEELDAVLRADRTRQDILEKAPRINEGMIRQVDRGEREVLRQENRRLETFKTLKEAANAATDLKNQFERFYGYVLEQVPMVIRGLFAIGDGVAKGLDIIKSWDLGGKIQKIADSPYLRFLMPGSKKP